MKKIQIVQINPKFKLNHLQSPNLLVQIASQSASLSKVQI